MRLFRSLRGLEYRNQMICFRMTLNSQTGYNVARVSIVFMAAELDCDEVWVQPIPRLT